MAYTDIDDPTQFFNTILYTGNDASNRGITGVNFAPDWVWIKKRNNAAGGVISDTVRGAGKVLYSSETNAEGSESASFVSFDSDGYTISQDAGVGLNVNSHTYVGWNWKAGGSASSNSDGSITSSVSANTTAGFSIVSYTGNGTAGATVGHGLGSVPKVVMVKTRSGTGNWINYHSSVGNTKYLSLNQTNSAGTTSQAWNDTSPTSSVFSLGNSSEVNGSGTTMIAYCFADVKGYSKFGSYTGNGNANGTFVYTGFKPAFFLMKETTDSATNWIMYDNKRSTFNAVDDFLKPNSSDAESTGLDFDFLSNGIKCRNNNSGINASGQNYIFMAFAEEPLVANVGASIPATAR